jgi:hypothetical protein
MGQAQGRSAAAEPEEPKLFPQAEHATAAAS